MVADPASARLTKIQWSSGAAGVVDGSADPSDQVGPRTAGVPEAEAGVELGAGRRRETGVSNHTTLVSSYLSTPHRLAKAATIWSPWPPAPPGFDRFSTAAWGE
jgi:hypothetical protein